MALTRANNAPNSILLTPYINIDGQAISLGSSINLLTTPNLTLNPSSGGIYFKTNSTQRMFIDNSGNIAVNISAPNIRSSPTGQYLTIGGTGAAGGVLELVNTNSDANNNYSTIVFAANANDQAVNKSIAQV